MNNKMIKILSLLSVFIGSIIILNAFFLGVYIINILSLSMFIFTIYNLKMKSKYIVKKDKVNYIFIMLISLFVFLYPYELMKILSIIVLTIYAPYFNQLLRKKTIHSLIMIIIMFLISVLLIFFILYPARMLVFLIIIIGIVMVIGGCITFFERLK